MTSITSIITLPVRVGIAVAQRVSDALGRTADSLEPEQPERPERTRPPSGAREPAKPTAAEAEALVGEQTDGIAEAGPARARRP